MPVDWPVETSLLPQVQHTYHFELTRISLIMTLRT